MSVDDHPSGPAAEIRNFASSPSAFTTKTDFSGFVYHATELFLHFMEKAPDRMGAGHGFPAERCLFRGLAANQLHREATVALILRPARMDDVIAVETLASSRHGVQVWPWRKPFFAAMKRWLRPR